MCFGGSTIRNNCDGQRREIVTRCSFATQSCAPDSGSRLAVQLNPFADGETVVVPRTDVAIEEEPGIGLAEVPQGASLSEEIAGLNALCVAPRDMIDILKSIKVAGALHAELLSIKWVNRVCWHC